MRTITSIWMVAGTVAVAGLGAAIDGCSASAGNGFGEGASGPGAGNPGGWGNSAGFDPGNGGGGSGGGIITNPCGTGCGDSEICGNGLDDDCDGQVDEGCPCTMGTVESCFKGDPSFANNPAYPGCFSGSQHCTELGTWGDCVGGVHAVPPDNCATASQTGCHPITAVPFTTVNLHDGVGNFGDDAVSESWSVACPPNVSPCPAVGGSNPADDFQPLQSGEYTVTYNKTTANGSDQCTYPLFVGAPGLRVELQWEHLTGQTDQVDIDLHLHTPYNANPWGGSSGNADDCGYNNCVANNYVGGYGGGVEWFNGAAPPDPVAWSPPGSPENTTCYNAPRGVGAQWQTYGQGCHNPRLDLDNIQCTPSVGDVNDPTFCAPENINVDYPPYDMWFRIGAYYYLNWGNSNPVVHPTVKIYCNGHLAGDFGSSYPSGPVTYVSGDSASKYWLVADVKFRNDPCDPSACTVVPLYGDANQTAPYLSTSSTLAGTFGPPYPP